MAALFVNHLTVLDFSFIDPDHGILGESWIVDVELHGRLDEQGMVFDFGDVKKQVRDAVEDLIDHKLIVPATLPNYQMQIHDEQADLRWQDTQGRQYVHISPLQAIERLEQGPVTQENLTPLLQQAAMRVVPDNVTEILITLRQEEINGASYQYSHGLKKHQGNCQRIAHGHRSRLKIYRNGKRDPLLEKAWALKWKHIYIGTESDLLKRYNEQGIDYCQFGYDAEQGRFELSLPARQVYLITTDSTVEHIAEHIACTLKQEDPDHTFTVKAYEGVMKGAIAIQ